MYMYMCIYVYVYVRKLVGTCMFMLNVCQFVLKIAFHQICKNTVLIKQR